jgi:ribosomal protein L37AE/L43A
MEKCIVCDKPATKYNEQGLPVCKAHENHEMMDMRCPFCKSYVDAKKGKFGTFFLCKECGPISRTKMTQFGRMYFMKK